MDEIVLKYSCRLRYKVRCTSALASISFRIELQLGIHLDICGNSGSRVFGVIKKRKTFEIISLFFPSIPFQIEMSILHDFGILSFKCFSFHVVGFWYYTSQI